jgi:hypothetical protein
MRTCLLIAGAALGPLMTFGISDGRAASAQLLSSALQPAAGMYSIQIPTPPPAWCDEVLASVYRLTPDAQHASGFGTGTASLSQQTACV